MAGTDVTRAFVDVGGPIIVLVEPQMAENIGTTARAMANFGLTRLRLVAPRDGWPNSRAYPAASGANRILDEAEVFDTLEAALADMVFVLATSARAHDQAKPVIGPSEAVGLMRPHAVSGARFGVVFGRERNGLLNEEVSRADAILTYPVNPAFASLNLAQAVLILAYEWFRQATDEALPLATPEKSGPAPRAQLDALFEMLERELDAVQFFRPPEKRDWMTINLRNLIVKMQPTRQDLATLHGVVLAIAEGAKGPARGGSLTPEASDLLRRHLEEQGAVAEHSPGRGLARLLRRNPTEAERLVWDLLTKDRRFIGRGYKRAVPIGPHVADLVSFPERVVVDFTPHTQGDDAAARRAEKRRWLQERGYRVIVMEAREAEAAPQAALERIGVEAGRAAPSSPGREAHPVTNREDG